MPAIMQPIVQMLIIVAATAVSSSAATPIMDTVYLNPGAFIDVTGNVYGAHTLRTYCYMGKRLSLLSMFETTEFVLSIQNEDYTEYGGRTPKEVMEHYNEQRSLFSFTLFSQKRQRVQLSPFEQQCIGVVTKEPYKVGLKHVPLDLWRFMQLAVGIMVFCSAGGLAKNNVFYYMAGIVLGICASLLVIIALTAKLFPKRPMMYGVLIGGWTIGFYILKQLMDNMRVILLTYREYVLGYLIVTGLISFLVCYRIGPPRNPRSQNIIKWVLQAVGGALVYFSSWHTSAAIALMVITFVVHYFPHSVLLYLKNAYRRRFPPKRRLLTMDEYYQQSVEETARSMAELRDFVNSPNCRQWSLMSRLRNPTRFANFANGAPHLDDEEIEDYSRAIEDELEGPDVDDDYLQCNMYYRPTAQRALRYTSSARQYAQREDRYDDDDEDDENSDETETEDYDNN
ncbi:nuclear envelope integral membrane protein 1 [Scaptodrosophila lebanonensis]|uniref:Nuclear envelope integral membrane protein 1 n=1 Tax=Drosophila lebanonensis TaxID=7225 RepID=A0A6J2TZH5_DROLE|nr:nuclear envelope integral membrane protein 1 [Scaptodrosophila lebanonensis]